MSRLDSFIRRMSAQRDILDDLARRPNLVPGPILEFGLGSARTYDHLRQRFPGRRILVFESVVIETVSPRPPPEDFIVGDLRETLALWPDGVAALVHTDIETGDPVRDADLIPWLPRLVARLLAPGGYAVSGSALPDPCLLPQPLPACIAEGRYHLLRRV